MNNGMNYTNDLNDSSNYSSRKILRGYKIGLLIVLTVSICLIVTFGINAYEVSQIDPFEKEGSTLPSDYLLSSAKTYFDFDATKLPSAVGECINVTLDTIKREHLISDVKYYNKCDGANTYVRVCKLESGNYHFEVSLACDDKTTVAVGSQVQIEDESEIIDKTNARVNFTYKAARLDTSDVVFGETQTYWQDEIPEELEYKVVKETTYYRYRTQLFKWSGDVKSYYPYNQTDCEKVIEYYKDTPDSNYPFKEVSQNYAYKWYIQNEEDGPKYYYPSGSTNPDDENTYYLVAPVMGAKRDDSTKTYAARYYNVTTTNESDYYAVAPSENATRLDTTMIWSDWSSYSLLVPSFSKGTVSEVEQRVQVELVPVVSGSIDENSWTDISDRYLSEEELLKELQSLGYDVQSISDVSSLRDVSYEVFQTYQDTTSA